MPATRAWLPITLSVVGPRGRSGRRSVVGRSPDEPTVTTVAVTAHGSSDRTRSQGVRASERGPGAAALAAAAAPAASAPSAASCSAVSGAREARTPESASAAPRPSRSAAALAATFPRLSASADAALAAEASMQSALSRSVATATVDASLGRCTSSSSGAPLPPRRESLASTVTRGRAGSQLELEGSGTWSLASTATDTLTLAVAALSSGASITVAPTWAAFARTCSGGPPGAVGGIVASTHDGSMSSLPAIIELSRADALPGRRDGDVTETLGSAAPPPGCTPEPWSVVGTCPAAAPAPAGFAGLKLRGRAAAAVAANTLPRMAAERESTATVTWLM
mmetsp:Transcript_3496/g.14468  ORF Transcript_3496/g.14468 Transcript_3496/m.14468 type:complete len:338 (+) Transcript_3496:4115-5128(+)